MNKLNRYKVYCNRDLAKMAANRRAREIRDQAIATAMLLIFFVVFGFLACV